MIQKCGKNLANFIYGDKIYKDTNKIKLLDGKFFTAYIYMNEERKNNKFNSDDTGKNLKEVLKDKQKNNIFVDEAQIKTSQRYQLNKSKDKSNLFNKKGENSNTKKSWLTNTSLNKMEKMNSISSKLIGNRKLFDFQDTNTSNIIKKENFFDEKTLIVSGNNSLIDNKITSNKNTLCLLKNKSESKFVYKKIESKIINADVTDIFTKDIKKMRSFSRDLFNSTIKNNNDNSNWSFFKRSKSIKKNEINSITLNQINESYGLHSQGIKKLPFRDYLKKKDLYY